MQDLRKDRQKNLIAWKKFQLYVLQFRFWLIKKKWWLFFLMLFMILFAFPEESGSVIGNWIDMFFGSIFKSSGLVGLIIFFILFFVFALFNRKDVKK